MTYKQKTPAETLLESSHFLKYGGGGDINDYRINLSQNDKNHLLDWKCNLHLKV